MEWVIPLRGWNLSTYNVIYTAWLNELYGLFEYDKNMIIF